MGGWIRGLAEDMPFEAKALAPSGSDPEALHGAFEDAAAGGVAVLEAPSGHVLAEGLAMRNGRSGAPLSATDGPLHSSATGQSRPRNRSVA